MNSSAGETLFTGSFETSFGPMFAAVNESGALVYLTFRRADQPESAEFGRVTRAVRLVPDARRCAAVAVQMNEYFAGERHHFDLTLAPPGTPFQQRVWNALIAIPYGTTTSYGVLAAALDQPKAVRAVGHANGQNRIVIIIPCHRVIGSNGGLHGYAFGLEMKARLLHLEGAPAAAFQPTLFA